MSAARNPNGRAVSPNSERPKLALDVPDALIEAVADRVIAKLGEQASAPSPWLSVAEAAERLRCKPDRVYDLIALGKLTPRRDGRRVLLRRDALDAYIEASA
jgi:excisionase family DNA binding protein